MSLELLESIDTIADTYSENGSCVNYDQEAIEEVDDHDPFYLGTRHLWQPNGQTIMVPLSLEDWLHPKVGDVRVSTKNHKDAAIAVHYEAEKIFKKRGCGVSFYEQHLTWGKLKLRPHIKALEPDVALIPQLPLNSFQGSEKSYQVTPDTIPELVVEVLSDNTAHLDRHIKRECYERIGVRQLVLVDVRPKIYKPRHPLIQSFLLEELNAPTANGHKSRSERVKRQYVEQIPNDQGHVLLECLDIWAGVENLKIHLFGHDGTRLVSIQEAHDVLDETQERAQKSEDLLSQMAEIALTASTDPLERFAMLSELLKQHAANQPKSPTSEPFAQEHDLQLAKVKRKSPTK